MTTINHHIKTRHYHAALLPSINLQQQRQLPFTMSARKQGIAGQQQRRFEKTAAMVVKCGRGIQDFIGGDLVRFDLGRWLSDVEEHKALAIYSPHEGGYEGRYLNRLRYKGYHFLDLSARGLGDPETTLTKVHPVCPAHLGKQPIARWYFPPEVDYRLQMLPPNAAGLVVWILEAKVNTTTQPLKCLLGRCPILA